MGDSNDSSSTTNLLELIDIRPIMEEEDTLNNATCTTGINHPLSISSDNSSVVPGVSFCDELTANTRNSTDSPDGIQPSINISEEDSSPPSTIHTSTVSLHREKLKRLKSRLNLQNLSKNEIDLKAALYFHICNPLKRWRVERLVPYKLILQVVKTVFLIAQVLLFTYSITNSRFLFLYESGLLFNRLFIKGNGSSETFTRRGYSYTQSNALEQMNYVIERYYQLPNITLGSYGHQLLINDTSSSSTSSPSIHPILVTIREYRQAEIDPSLAQYNLDSTLITSNVYISINASSSDYSLIELLAAQGIELSFTKLVYLDITLYLRGVHITDKTPPECYSFTVTVRYSKDNVKSLITYHLTHNYEQIGCHGNMTPSVSVFTVCLIILDIIIILTSIISTLFILHNYRKGYILGKAMGEFYLLKLNITISWFERKDIFSLWHLFTMFSDIFIILGSLLKVLFEFNVDVHSVTVRILLGSALIVQSAAMLRYFSFFKQFNALTRTLGAAAPELVKFLFCTSMLYFAFALCGLIVFGSYNKEMFGNFSNSVEILFALINGDSIWLVFREFSEDDIFIYIYSRFFVYMFIFLFIYAVLNLFTSLVKSSYDDSTLVDRASINEVRRFVFSGPLTKDGAALRDVTYVQKYVNPAVILKKRKSRKGSSIGDLD